MITLSEMKYTDFNNPESKVAAEFPYCDEFVQVVRAIPGRVWDYNGKRWLIPLSGCKTLVDKVHVYNVSFQSERLKAYVLGENYLKEHEERIQKTRDRLSKVVLEYPYDFKIKPFPHQIEAFNKGVRWHEILIGDEQGCGKTSTAAWIADYRFQRGDIRKCLIVCGVNSVKYNWVEEIHKCTNQDAVVFDQAGDDAKMKAIKEWEKNDILFGIINIEAIRPTDVTKREQNRFLRGQANGTDLPMRPIVAELNKAIQMVIVDEIHKAKNPMSKQGIALRQIDPTYRVGLSGTPLTNKLLDLWNILSWAHRCTISYWDFRDTYCIMGGYEGRDVVGYKNLHSLYAVLHTIMVRRTKEEVLNLPPKTYETEYVDLSKDQRKLYAEAREGILKHLDQMMPTDNPLTMVLRLRQITSGLLTPETQNAKLKRIESMLEDEIIPNGRKAIVFSNWETETSIYKKAFGKFHPAYIVGATDPKDRQEEVNRFQNDPNCSVIIGTIGAMGTGLTLNKASYVFFTDKAWNETDNQQAEDRAHRIGTDSNVTVITMLAKNTIDEKIEEKLQEKANLFANVIDGGPATGRLTPQHMSNKDLVRSLIE